MQSHLIHGLYLLGVASLVYGAWLIYHPAGFLAGGLFLVFAAILIDKQKQETE